MTWTYSEVADPVGASRGGRSDSTGAERVDFWWVDPWEREDGECEEDDEKVDTDGGTLRVLSGWVHQATHGDDEGETLTEETDEEELAATDLLNHEEGWDGGKRVDRGEHTTQDEGETVLKTDGLLEQKRRVVDGGIASSELLEELRGGSDHHALELLGLAEGEEVADTARGTSRFDVGLHQVQIGEHTLVALRNVVQGGQHLAGFVLVTLLHEPSWRLGQDTHTNNHDDGEEDLEGDWESPLDGGVDVAETEVDPVGDKSSDSDDGTFQTDEQTAVLGLRSLRLPDRNGCRVHSISNTRDDTPDDELAECPVALEASGRNNGSNDEDDTTGKAKTCATDPLTEGEGEDGTEEASDFVASSNGTSNDGDMLLVCSTRAIWHHCCWKFRVELRSRNETRHQALVVSEEREAHD